jgi:hypothetical protein
MGLRPTVNEDDSGASAGLYAPPDRCKLLHNSIHQRWTRPPECLDSVRNSNLSDRLTDLNAYATVSVGYDAVERGLFNCSSADVAAASTLTKCLDGGRELDFSSDAEMNEASTTRSILPCPLACQNAGFT